MKKYIIFLVLCCLIHPIFAEATTLNTINRNYYPRRYYNKNYNVLPPKNLKALEEYAMQKNFSRDAELNRLERLEELAFGSIQSGDINTRYQNVENAILSRPQNNYKSNWRNNFNSYFTGQPTGITPSVSPFFSQNYIPSYSNSRIEQLNNGLWGNGYRINTNGYTSGSGIRLLD